MTQDRALKQAIRRRMEQTGEKYTEARRALLGAAAAAEPPWYYEPYWEEQRRRYEEAAGRQGEAAARAVVYSSLHNFQLLFTLIPFQPTGDGREPFRPEGWLPQSSEVERNAAAVEASTPLVPAGFGPQIERNRRIVERVLALIDEQGQAAAERARKKAEEERARERGEGAAASSGVRSRTGLRQRARSLELGHDPVRGQYPLQHPRDNWLRVPGHGIGDPVLSELVEAWIEDLDRNYRALVKDMPPSQHQHGELDFEALIEGPDEEEGGDWTIGLPSPARVRVERPLKGAVNSRELLATHRLLVEGDLSAQPDGIAAIPGERWHIRGHRLSDGTIMPCWGTYRVTGAT